MFVPNRIDKDVFYRTWHRAGHEFSNCDEIAPDQYDLLEYCSCRFMRIGGGRRLMVPKITRMFKAFTSVKEVSTLLEHAVGVAIGWRHYAFVPVIGVVIKQLLGVKGKFKPVLPGPYQPFLKHTLPEINEIVVYEWFEAVYGFNARILEQDMRRVDWTIMGRCYNHPLLDVMMAVDGVDDRHDPCTC